MKKITIKLNNLAKSITSLEKYQRNGSPVFERSLKRTNGAMDKKVNEILAMTGDLPDEDVRGVEADLKKLRERLGILTGRIDERGGPQEQTRGNRGEATTNNTIVKLLKKIVVKTNNLAKSIVSLEEYKRKESRAFERSLARANDSMAKKADEILVMASVLPDAHRSTIEADVRNLRQRLTAVTKMTYETAERKAAFEQRWDDHRQTAVYRHDIATIEAILALAANIFDINSRFFEYGGDDRIEEVLDLLSRMPSMKAEVGEIGARYQPFGDLAHLMMTRVSWAEEKLLLLAQQVEVSKAGGEAFLQEKDRQLQRAVEEVFERKASAETMGRSFSTDYCLMADGQPAVRILRAIKRVASFLLAASNGDLMSAKRLSDNSTKFYQGIIGQLAENVTANKTTPEDSYTGDDREALEKFVYAHLLGEEIVGVYFRGGWYQEKKQNWVASNASFEEVNRSSLEGMVLMKIDNEWALERWIRLIKDHMNGDKLILQRDRQPNPNPRPSEKIHLSKV